MAQIIKHRRGSLESLSSVTGSLVKGEIVIATGSANLSNVTNGQGLTFAAHADGQIKAVNRVLKGNNPNIFSGSIYNGLLDGVPFYASSSKTLYLLGSDTNEAIDLTGNISTFSTSVDSRLDSLESSLGGGGSVGTRVANLETISASYLAFTQSYYTTSGSFATAISASDAEYTAFSASEASARLSLSASLATAISASDAEYTSFSASANTAYAKLSGTNIYNGDQVITGSIYVSANLIVQGSSSLQNITASAANIGTNTIILNTSTPAVRFGGISVQDSGSTNGRSGSLMWDSQNDHWININPSGSDEGYNSAMVINGPKNSGSLGNEVGLTLNRIPVAQGEDHITDSQITDDGTTVSIPGTLSASVITGIGNVSGYSSSVASRVQTIETSLGGGGSLGTRVANLETISSSYLAFTQSYYTTSGSIFTQFSASAFTATANSASLQSAITSLSASNATTDNTQTANITTATNAAAGAFASASAYSASLTTTINTLSSSNYQTDVTQSINISTATAAAAGAFASASAYSGSFFTTINSLSSSNYQTDVTQSTNISIATAAAAGAFASASAYSASFATAISASDAEYTSYSASAASALNALSSSLAGNSTLSASVYQTDATQSANIATATAAAAGAFASASAYSSSAYQIDLTQSVNIATATAAAAGAFASASAYSGSEASARLSLSSSVATTNNGQTDRIVKLEASQSNFDTALTLSGQNVTVKGDLIVNGTTTTVNSTTIELGDNIISLRGTTSAFGGIQISDAVSPSSVSGSLLWDLTNDYWIAGKSGSEVRLADINFVSTSVAALSQSAASALASAASTAITTLSSSVYLTDATQSNNIATATAAAAGAFASASAYSSSAYQINLTQSVNITTATNAAAGAFASASAYSASLFTTINSLSASNYQTDVTQSSTLTTFSSSISARLAFKEAQTAFSGTFSGSITASGLNMPGGSNTKRIAFRGTGDNIEFVAAPTTSGDLVQWDGTNFVMSATIDGGTF